MNLFAELRRRHVFRVAGLYMVVAWIVVQVTGTLSPMMNLPEWLGGVVLVILLAGLPVVIFVAWAFELTPDGLRPTPAPEEEASVVSPRIMDIAIVAGLIVVIGLTVWQSAFVNRGNIVERMEGSLIKLIVPQLIQTDHECSVHYRFRTKSNSYVKWLEGFRCQRVSISGI